MHSNLPHALIQHAQGRKRNALRSLSGKLKQALKTERFISLVWPGWVGTLQFFSDLLFKTKWKERTVFLSRFGLGLRVFCPEVPRDALQPELRVQGERPVCGAKSPSSHKSVPGEAQEQSRALGNVQDLCAAPTNTSLAGVWVPVTCERPYFNEWAGAYRIIHITDKYKSGECRGWIPSFFFQPSGRLLLCSLRPWLSGGKQEPAKIIQ